MLPQWLGIILIIVAIFILKHAVSLSQNCMIQSLILLCLADSLTSEQTSHGLAQALKTGTRANRFGFFVGLICGFGVLLVFLSLING